MSRLVFWHEWHETDNRYTAKIEQLDTVILHQTKSGKIEIDYYKLDDHLKWALELLIKVLG